jgi:hypothetical protein
MCVRQELHLLVLEQQRQVERLNAELVHLTAMLAEGKRPSAPPPAAVAEADHTLPPAKVKQSSSSCVIS